MVELRYPAPPQPWFQPKKKPPRNLGEVGDGTSSKILRDPVLIGIAVLKSQGDMAGGDKSVKLRLKSFLYVSFTALVGINYGFFLTRV